MWERRAAKILLMPGTWLGPQAKVSCPDSSMTDSSIDTLLCNMLTSDVPEQCMASVWDNALACRCSCGGLSVASNWNNMWTPIKFSRICAVADSQSACGLFVCVTISHMRKSRSLPVLYPCQSMAMLKCL